MKILNIIAATTFATLMLFGAAHPGLAAEDDSAAPGYLESIVAPGDGGGIDEEIDAAAAQAKAAQAGGAVLGVSPRRAARIEEIVVQARRRDEFLEDTPISVTALDANTFVEAQITDFAEIQALVPNLQIDTGRSGNDAQISIRGVRPTEGGNASVGTYVDGVFIAGSLASVLNVGDIRQIEVLRGPQGTLFGKNTLAGAINITTARPAEELGASVWVRAGDYATVETRSSIDLPIAIGPLTDRVFTRFSFSTARTQGYTENLESGLHSNNANSLWFLGKVRALLTDDVELNLSGNWTRTKSRGAAGQCVLVPEAAGSLEGLVRANSPDFYDQCAASGMRDFRSPLNLLGNSEDYGLWGNLTWNLGAMGWLEDLNLKLIGSWREGEVRQRQDVDMTVSRVVNLTNVSFDGVEAAPLKTSQSLVEAHATGVAADGSLHFLLGAFAQWNDSDVAEIVASMTPLLDQSGGFTVSPVAQRNHDWAFFGQASWDATEWLNLTTGLRYSSETRKLTRTNIFPFGDGSTDQPVITAQGTGDVTYAQWTPMVSVSTTLPDELLGETPLDHLMGYATWARGFSAGGFNAVIGSGTGTEALIPYGPSLLDNYEIGLKTMAFDQRMTANLSLFFMDYDGIQVVQAKTIPVPGSDIPQTARLIENAASATMRGMELEFTIRPIDGLMVMWNAGVLDSSYGDYATTSELDSVTEINRKGESFGNPAFTSYLAVQYSTPINLPGPSWLRGWLTPRVDWSYVGPRRVAPPEIPIGFLPHRNTVNARLSYDFLDDRAQVALWTRNLTDSAEYAGDGGTAGFFGYSVLYWTQPRTFGAEVSYRFD
ncbi:MAG: TonB-dependent receptor [Deltaproteobacteria bacterium]